MKQTLFSLYSNLVCSVAESELWTFGDCVRIVGQFVAAHNVSVQIKLVGIALEHCGITICRKHGHFDELALLHGSSEHFSVARCFKEVGRKLVFFNKLKKKPILSRLQDGGAVSR